MNCGGGNNVHCSLFTIEIWSTSVDFSVNQSGRPASHNLEKILSRVQGYGKLNGNAVHGEAFPFLCSGTSYSWLIILLHLFFRSGCTLLPNFVLF